MGIRDKRGQGFQMASEPRASKQVRTYISVLDSARKTRILDWILASTSRV